MYVKKNKHLYALCKFQRDLSPLAKLKDIYIDLTNRTPLLQISETTYNLSGRGKGAKANADHSD